MFYQTVNKRMFRILLVIITWSKIITFFNTNSHGLVKLNSKKYLLKVFKCLVLSQLPREKNLCADFSRETLLKLLAVKEPQKNSLL